jgi:hypothetical protein
MLVNILKTKRHGNNNSHQFRELLQQNPEVPQKQKNLLHPITQSWGLLSHHLRPHQCETTSLINKMTKHFHLTKQQEPLALAA